MAEKKSIRIRLKAFDHAVLDLESKKIVETVTRTNASEMRIHKRLIDIVEPNNKTVESLQRLEVAAGVDIEIKIQ